MVDLSSVFGWQISEHLLGHCDKFFPKNYHDNNSNRNNFFTEIFELFTK